MRLWVCVVLVLMLSSVYRTTDPIRRFIKIVVSVSGGDENFVIT